MKIDYGIRHYKFIDLQNKEEKRLSVIKNLLLYDIDNFNENKLREMTISRIIKAMNIIENVKVDNRRNIILIEFDINFLGEPEFCLKVLKELTGKSKTSKVKRELEHYRYITNGKYGYRPRSPEEYSYNKREKIIYAREPQLPNLASSIQPPRK